MKKESATEIVVKNYYAADDFDVIEVLKDSILLFIEGEVEDLCYQSS